MLTLTPLQNIPLIQPGDDLAEILLAGLSGQGLLLQDDDILVLAQKIVSKAEGRAVRLADVKVGDRAAGLAEVTGKDPRLIQVILDESCEIIRARPGLIIVEHRLGFISANAGVDHSNVPESEEYVLQLPVDPDASAARLRQVLETVSGKRLGVLIIDSHGRAWRSGTVGVAIGLSGLPGVVDRRGDHDLFGRELVATIVGAADELAAAASLVMGQADEGLPVVLARGFPYPLAEGKTADILRPKESDLFR